ncbi:RNA:NAD 2'-phosphotransferase [Minicystis rosea]|nr:RNA:NAD 2'-phosphotransferase [Minicystis rosea]
MSNRNGNRASHKLSWLLRHGAEEAGLDMDAAGWAEIADVLRVLRMSRAALEQAVIENEKARYEVRGGRIRACQGHSRAGMPVTLAALEDSWTPFTGDAPVWHGTRIAALSGIAREGILAGDRTHVHLAASLDSVVGKRGNVDVMLEVSPDRLAALGHRLFVSPNGVILARWVPPPAIVGLRCVTDRARRQSDGLRAVLGLGGEAAAPL